MLMCIFQAPARPKAERQGPVILFSSVKTGCLSQAIFFAAAFLLTLNLVAFAAFERNLGTLRLFARIQSLECLNAAKPSSSWLLDRATWFRATYFRLFLLMEVCVFFVLLLASSFYFPFLSMYACPCVTLEPLPCILSACVCEICVSVSNFDDSILTSLSHSVPVCILPIFCSSLYMFAYLHVCVYALVCVCAFVYCCVWCFFCVVDRELIRKRPNKFCHDDCISIFVCSSLSRLLNVLSSSYLPVCDLFL